jgi:hypothetical protein
LILILNILQFGTKMLALKTSLRNLPKDPPSPLMVAIYFCLLVHNPLNERK